MVSRRTVLLAGTAAAAVAVVAKPRDDGGPYPPYFARLNEDLRREGIDRPVLVIDLDRLDRNVDRLTRSVATVPGRTYRIVVKSLPSAGLVDYVASRASTQALMCFHRPFLEEMARVRPQSDILLGKPLPVSAVQVFYASDHGRFDAANQLQWLIDTPARLAQYQALARARGLRLRVNLEIDVGLHRGGFETPEALAPVLQTIAADPAHLAFAGFMGYDAHLMGLPGFLAKSELPKVKARYGAFVEFVRTRFSSLAGIRMTCNGAGSPTFRHYEGDPLLNDVAAGTCLMKPTHYDLPTLEEFEASAFIATPVLKRLAGGRLPALDWTAPLIRAWDPNQEQTYFAYSGNWLAECEAPPGLRPHFAYTSSNQQGYTASGAVPAQVDDFIFLRPQQSEAVLLQFGDLVAMRKGRIEARWPVIPVGI
jgi:D-serine deaminase-like pyridoxal phosphate-dependent protein